MAPRKETAVPSSFRELLERGQLFLEKCELVHARATFLEVIDRAQCASASESGPDDVAPREAMIEAIAVMLRLSAEAKDEAGIAQWNAELERCLPEASGRTLAMAWHNRSVVATYERDYRRAQSYLLQALRALRKAFGGRYDFATLSLQDRKLAGKVWAATGATFMDRNLEDRMHFTADALIRRFEPLELNSQLTTLYIEKGVPAERSGRIEEARQWYQKAHARALADRNWYFHLYVLYAYARLERASRNFAQAYLYLELISAAANGPEFGNLQAIVQRERDLLEQDAVDLLIDSRQCEVRTREKKDLSLGKQYVLLGILEALTEAHYRDAPDSERGLSKSEIIERVWREKYRPESHDNKLYYNINRLRKLIEPDMRHPKYLLNWKEGYRLAPGLKVQFIGGSAPAIAAQSNRGGL
jgi:DNA-binding winged helix-turn-helix (wHTH) protein